MSLGVRKDLSCEKWRPREILVFHCVSQRFRKVKEFEKRAEVFENLVKINLETSSENEYFRCYFSIFSDLIFDSFWGPFGGPQPLSEGVF